MPYSLTSSKCIHQISHEGNSWWWWPNLKIQTKITHYSNSAAFEFVTPLTNRYFWNQEIILAQLKEIHSIIITVNLFTAQVVQISPKLLTQLTNMFSQIYPSKPLTTLGWGWSTTFGGLIIQRASLSHIADRLFDMTISWSDVGVVSCWLYKTVHKFG